MAAGPTVKRLMETYKGKVQLVIKNIPLARRDHSEIAAEASLAALDQGKYWEMHNILISRSPKLDRENLITYARELGLNVKLFTAAIDGRKHAQAIERDRELAARLAVLNTPTFFINGRKVVGNLPFDYFRRIIDEELGNAECSSPVRNRASGSAEGRMP